MSSLLEHINHKMEGKVRKTSSQKSQVIYTDKFLVPGNETVLVVKGATLILPSLEEMTAHYPQEEAITLNLLSHTGERVIVKTKNSDLIHVAEDESEGTSASNGKGKFVSALVLMGQTTVAFVYDLYGRTIFYHKY